MEFLCTLNITNPGVNLRFFGKEYSTPWKDFSRLLGFDAQCVVDVDSTIQDFYKTKFWREIFGKTDFFHPRTNDINNPTLHFMHKWLGMTLFPRNDTRTIRTDDLKLMYAMVKRKKVSPIKFMMNQWLKVFTLVGDVECPSLVTRIATNMGLMQRSFVSLITECPYIDFEYF